MLEFQARLREHRSCLRLKPNKIMAGLPHLRQSKVFVAAPVREEERQEGAEERQGDGQRLGGYPR